MAVVDFLKSYGATLVAGRVAHFGKPAQEADGLLGGEGAFLIPLMDHGFLRLTGPDRVPFLHGLLANDVRNLEVGGVKRSLMLNVRGHALAQMTVLRRREELLMAVEDAQGPLVTDILRAHIIFDQVELETEDATLAAFTLQGSEAGELLRKVVGGVPEEPGVFSEQTTSGGMLLLNVDVRTPTGGFDLYVPSGDAEALIASLMAGGAHLVGQDALQTARVCAGFPSAAREGGEGVLPQEAGLTGEVSFDKGCYLGQEIMARVKARGSLHRQLTGLRLSAVPITAERRIRFHGRRVGQLGTVVDYSSLGVIALAVLRDDLPSGAELEVGGVRGWRVELPFVAFDT